MNGQISKFRLEKGRNELQLPHERCPLNAGEENGELVLFIYEEIGRPKFQETVWVFSTEEQLDLTFKYTTYGDKLFSSERLQFIDFNYKGSCSVNGETLHVFMRRAP